MEDYEMYCAVEGTDIPQFVFDNEYIKVANDLHLFEDSYIYNEEDADKTFETLTKLVEKINASYCKLGLDKIDYYALNTWKFRKI